MEMSSVNQQQMASVQQALSTMTLDQSMNRSEATMDKLMEGMQEMSQEIQQVQNNATGQGSQAVHVDFRV
ncbi:hypothetical protein I0Q91_12285 [Halanaerobiaceae bacterium Z-7014]|uniref:Motility protein n=1 Tax=Halonatronomonas betaini TaxID=2778430 RepID=A0A931ASY2_9FIRM|nr:hypothetical protein [Halonatronomonas betaini]MBF8437867.1 hypothetical protein [Halonatronomonas betaini]